MDFESICRLCAKEKSTLRNIAEDERNVNLVEQIRDIIRIEVVAFFRVLRPL